MSEHVDGPPCEHVPDGRIMVVPGRPDRDWLAVKCPCCGMRAWNEPGEPLDGGDPCPYCDQFPVLVHVPAEQTVDTEAVARAIRASQDGTPVADADFEALKRLQAAVVDSGVAAFPDRAEQTQPSGYTPPAVGAYTDVQCGDPHPSRPGVTCTKAARHIRRPEPQVAAHGAHTPAGYDAWVHEGESGYTPPEVGAPTWPRANPGATISERGDRLEIEWPNGRGMSWVAPKVIEGWVAQVNELRAERDRLRAAVAKVRRGEPLTEADSWALAEVAW